MLNNDPITRIRYMSVRHHRALHLFNPYVVQLEHYFFTPSPTSLNDTISDLPLVSHLFQQLETDIALNRLQRHLYGKSSQQSTLPVVNSSGMDSDSGGMKRRSPTRAASALPVRPGRGLLTDAQQVYSQPMFSAANQKPGTLSVLSICTCGFTIHDYFA